MVRDPGTARVRIRGVPAWHEDRGQGSEGAEKGLRLGLLAAPDARGAWGSCLRASTPTHSLLSAPFSLP